MKLYITYFSERTVTMLKTETCQFCQFCHYESFGGEYSEISFGFIETDGDEVTRILKIEDVIELIVDDEIWLMRKSHNSSELPCRLSGICNLIDREMNIRKAKECKSL